MIRIACVSGNAKKLAQYQELHRLLGINSFELYQEVVEVDEIQSVVGSEVIADKVKKLRAIVKTPFIVDDVSLLIDGYEYPGALIKHLLKNVPLREIPKFLPEGAQATVVSYLGYFDGATEHIFTGSVQGTISYAAPTAPTLDALVYLESNFLGELPVTENHRGRAFAKFVEYLEKSV